MVDLKEQMWLVLYVGPALLACVSVVFKDTPAEGGGHECALPSHTLRPFGAPVEIPEHRVQVAQVHFYRAFHRRVAARRNVLKLVCWKYDLVKSGGLESKLALEPLHVEFSD